MKRVAIYLFIYIFVVCIFGVIYGMLWPPMGKSPIEILGNISMFFFGVIVLYGMFFGGVFAFAWLLARFSGNGAFDPNQIVYDDKPDLPESFGYKCQWIAVKSDDADRIAEVLELSDRKPCNWAAGIQNGYLDDVDAPVFVSSSIQGWCFIVGRAALPSSATEHDELVALLNRLSEEFGEACFFGTMRITGFAAWFRSKNGHIVRKFMYADEVVYDEGERTGIESEVSYIDHDFDSENEKPPRRSEYPGSEDWVMQIAADWCLDPTKLEEIRKVPKAVGLMGYLPK